MVGCLIGIVLRFLIAFETEADHFHYPHDHIASLLRASEEERNCIRVEDGSVNHETARNLISGTLSYASDPAKDWDGIRFVDFSGNTDSAECPNTSPLHGIKIFFLIQEDWDGNCGSGTAGCANNDWPIEDLGSGHYGMTPAQVEYRLSVIRMETPALIYDTKRVVNHEVGHALGLSHGPGVCSDSIMHSCTSQEWPSDSDRNSVEGLVPWSGSPGGGGAGSKGFGV